MRNFRSFRHAVRRTPRTNFVWKVDGMVHVQKPGTYKICTRSDDGSKLWVKGRMIVNNDGLHGARTKCGSIRLPRGNHVVKSIGFQRGGGAYMAIFYYGPDTGGHKKKLRSLKPPRGRRSLRWASSRGWRLSVYKGRHGMSKVPSMRGLRRVGSARLGRINLRSWWQFKRIIRRTPRNNFVWRATGQVHIKRAGRYTFCTTSDDGSKLWIRGRRVVNNDGLHGARSRCGAIRLTRGNHNMKSIGFQRGGGAYFRITYKGPDTSNRRKAVQSRHPGHHRRHHYRYRRHRHRHRRHARRYWSRTGWRWSIYKGPANMRVTPNTRGLKRVGMRRMGLVNLRNFRAFRRTLRRTPRVNFVWKATGTVHIQRPGTYKFCTRSDDGSKLYVKTKLVVNNEGLHGPRTKCGSIKLARGNFLVKGVGFQKGGGAYFAITYQGKDTGNRRRKLRSLRPPPWKRQKSWASSRGWRFSVYKGPRGMSRTLGTTRGLRKLGSRRVGRINLRNQRHFRNLIRRTPHSNFVWKAEGTVYVKRPGRYTMCSESDDGSKVWLDGRRIVNNDGLHGPRTRCGSRTLAKGDHVVKSIGFQRGGGAFFALRYKGLDTGNNMVKMQSKKPPPKTRRARPWASRTGWRLSVYKGPTGMSSVPSTRGLKRLGSARMGAISLRNFRHFRRYVRRTPRNNFVWKAAGTMRVHRAGTYKLCTRSDDGSKLYVKTKLVVNNDGLHGPRTKCGSVRLTKGDHVVKSVGFQRGGGAYMAISYSGPDTGGHKKKLRSLKPPPFRRQKRWASGRGWIWRVYKGPSGMSKVPSTRGLRRVGTRRLGRINFRNWRNMRQLVRRTPRNNFVWKATGTVHIQRRGRYTWCTTSDDGSKMWVKGRQVVNNDGLHGARKRCGHITLNPGNYPMRAVGFQRGGGHSCALRTRAPTRAGTRSRCSPSTAGSGIGATTGGGGSRTGGGG